MDGQQEHEKMIRIANHQKNANKSHNEIPPHTCQNGYYQKDEQVLARIWRKGKCIETSLCWIQGIDIVLQANYISKTNSQKRDQIYDQICGERVLDEGSQNVQTPSYKLSTRDVIYIMVKIINIAVLKLLRVNPKSSHYQDKNFFYFFYVVLI